MTDIDVVNLALKKRGKQAISSFSDTSVEGDFANKFFYVLFDMFLEAHTWSFAKKEAAIALSSGATSNQFTYVYAVPSDCIKVREIYSGNTTKYPREQRVNYAKSGLEIACDVEDAILVYTARITNMNLLSQRALTAFIELLKANIVEIIDKDTVLGEQLEQKYEDVYLKRAIDDDLSATYNPAKLYRPIKFKRTTL